MKIGFFATAALMTLLAVPDVSAQWGRRYQDRDPRAGVPEWENTKGFEKDVFTFARLEYSSYGRGGRGRGGWRTDWPDADLNFSYRLQQLTSLKVDPDGVTIAATSPELHKYPFIYMAEPGSLSFTTREVEGLRAYLLNGGFLMVDDFWGEDEWRNFYYEIKQVFPDREPVDLTIDHEIFNTVFPLRKTLQTLPQIPNVDLGTQSQYHGVTWERSDAQEVHYRAIFDDKGRMMVIICHNTDLGDGWEREGDNEYYFREFSEKKAYPLGINIVFYAMTH